MAREKEMPQILSMINRERRTPVTAAIFNVCVDINSYLARER